MELTSSHKYIKNTSTYGPVLTEYPLNAEDLIESTLQKDHCITGWDEGQNKEAWDRPEL